MPATAFSSVTLWKDIPYAASVVAITAAVISLLFLHTPRISHPIAFALSLAVLLVCVLFRHNGPLIALASLLIVFALSRASRKGIALLALSVARIAMILKGPMIGALGVERSNVAFTLYAHHIAAHLEAGEAAPTKESGSLFHKIFKGTKRLAIPLQRGGHHDPSTLNSAGAWPRARVATCATHG